MRTLALRSGAGHPHRGAAPGGVVLPPRIHKEIHSGMRGRPAGEQRESIGLLPPLLPAAAASCLSRSPPILHTQCHSPPDAASYAAGMQGQGAPPTMQQKGEKESMGARILAGVLSLSSAPYRQAG